MIANKGSSKSVHHQESLSEDNAAEIAQMNDSHPIPTSLYPIIPKDRSYSLEKHLLNFTNVSISKFYYFIYDT